MVDNLGSDDLTSKIGTNLDPWQETMPRWHSVPAAKIAQAAEVIRGLAGSWAASYQFDYGVQNENRSIDSGVSNPQQVKSSRIGQPGFPEVNFAPYNYGTNRFGSKGGSFIGHPISFEVVGPTAKNVETQFYWDVTAGLTHDTITMSADTIANVFGLVDMTHLHGGLYLIVSQTGSVGSLITQAGTTISGGIGDGCDLDGAKNGLVPLFPQSKYEIFRITALRDNLLVLDKSKRLSTYFTIPVNPIIRSITLIRPKATRLVVVPGSGSKVFAVVPPKRASIQDDQYTYATWTGAPWYETNLPQYLNGSGTEFSYKYGPVTPIPRPLGYWHGRLQGINPATGAAEAIATTQAGTFVLYPTVTDPGYPSTSLTGKVIHVTGVQSKNGAILHTDTSGTGSDFQRGMSSLMGWFEVIDYNGVYAIVRRVSETDPSTGFPVIGAPTWYSLEDTGDPTADQYKSIEVSATVHDPIESLWLKSYVDVDTIQSAKLTNIIDPRWVERSAKSAGTSPNTYGMGPGRPDRAIFDTSSSSGASGYNSNPGSLLDLGFRMVLFPATLGDELDPAGGADISTVIPDWSKPVTSNEVILDPSKLNEKQYIEVDYANGLVRLSHAIVFGSDLYPTDAGVLTSDDNPRKEMALFACCVPYSMEEGQTGAGGIRVLGAQSFGPDGSTCGDDQATDAADVFSNRILAPVDPSSGVAGVITSQNHMTGQSVFLTGDWIYKIPPSGFFELLSGDSVNSSSAIGDSAYRGSLFGYSHTTIDVGRTLTEIHNVYGGGEYTVATVDTNSPTVAVFRREVVTPNDSTGKAGVSYQFDTTYGSAKRTPVLRFEDSDTSANVDGSTTIKHKDTNNVGNFDDLYSSAILKSGTVTASVDAGVSITFTIPVHTVLMRGHRIVVPESTVVISGDGTYYLYYVHNGGTHCPQTARTTDFPLPHPEDILIEKVTVSGGVTGYTLLPLQNPMTDLDRRLDIYVGEIGGSNADWTAFQPHFKTLYDGVRYANEMMTPDSGGLPYKNVRIMVVGRTHEPNARLPIQIKTNGLVIEGVPFYEGIAGGATKSEISWTDSSKNLIDLNGYSDLTFKNLAIRFEAGANPAVTTNSVFVDSSSQSFRVIIDNCRVVGYVYHFIDVSNFGLSDSNITNNKVGTLNGSGFYNVSAGAQVLRCRIENNTFVASSSTTQLSGIEIIAAELANFYATTKVTNVVIRNNSLSSFYNGIWIGSGTSIIDNNYISVTSRLGIVAAGGAKITNNTLIGVHSGAMDATWGFKCGILALTDPTMVTDISYNSVDMNAGVVGVNDDAIHVYDPVGTELAVVNVGHNKATVDSVASTGYIYVWAWGATIHDNSCYRLWVDGQLNTIRDNVSTQLLVNFDLTASAGSVLTHAIVDPSRNTVINNRVLRDGYVWNYTTVTDSVFLTSLHFQHDCKLTNNRIDLLSDFHGFGALATDSARPTIIGNEIVAVQTGGGTAGKLQLSGPFEISSNVFTGNVEIPTATSGIIGNNRFTGSLTLGTTASNNFTVTGNWIGTGGITVGAVAAAASFATVTGNRQSDSAGITGITAYSSYSNYTGNNTVYDSTHLGVIAMTGDHNTIVGNTTGTVTVAGAYTVIQGNKFLGNMTLTSASANSMVSNNVGITGGSGVLTIQCNSTVISGNMVNAITFADSKSNTMIGGNMVTDAVTLGGAVGTQTTQAVLNGNWIGGIVLPNVLPSSIIAMGNKATRIMDTNSFAGKVVNSTDNSTV